MTKKHDPVEFAARALKPPKRETIMISVADLDKLPGAPRNYYDDGKPIDDGMVRDEITAALTTRGASVVLEPLPPVDLPVPREVYTATFPTETQADRLCRECAIGWSTIPAQRLGCSVEFQIRPDDRAADWANMISILHEIRPRPIRKAFGKNGPSPEQETAWKAYKRAWDRENRRARKEHKRAMDALRTRGA